MHLYLQYMTFYFLSCYVHVVSVLAIVYNISKRFACKPQQMNVRIIYLEAQKREFITIFAKTMTLIVAFD